MELLVLAVKVIIIFTIGLAGGGGVMDCSLPVSLSLQSVKANVTRKESTTRRGRSNKYC